MDSPEVIGPSLEDEISRCVPELLLQSDLDKTTVSALHRELELKLGRDLSQHVEFIRHQITEALTKRTDLIKRAHDAASTGAQQKKKALKKKPGCRGKTKEVTDPTRPKGPKGPYMMFCAERRPKIKKEKPNLSFQDIARQLGTEWRTMSDSVRAQYEHMAENDKTRYAKELAMWTPLSSAEMEKLREEQRKRKAAGGLQVMYKCSPELSKFLGGVKEINRQALTTYLWKYFRKNDLMDPINKRYVVANEKLAKLLEMSPQQRFLAFSVSKHINRHLTKK